MDVLSFMAAPIVMCVVLVGLHVQLGLHVVRRGVIFVDIALAQSSALGAALGMLAGWQVGTAASTAAGMGTAMLAAGIISLTRSRHEVPQEAYIGITYVAAAAATVLALNRTPHGAEEVEALMMGSILWVSWADVLHTAVLYAALAVPLFMFRRRFHAVSNDAAGAEEIGMSVRAWDFLFYAILGITVSRSVQIAGVFLVFTFLVVPAVMALRVAPGRPLAIGWALGAGVAAIGALLSYAADLPTGATIVCTFAVALLLLVLVPPRKNPTS